MVIQKNSDVIIKCFFFEETLHRLVRSVVYELGMSASDSESDEDDLEDGDDPPSSPSPQPPDRPFSPIDVKHEETLKKTEETLRPDSKENIIRDNCSYPDSANAYSVSIFLYILTV